jgi:hypothetical protein
VVARIDFRFRVDQFGSTLYHISLYFSPESLKRLPRAADPTLKDDQP